MDSRIKLWDREISIYQDLFDVDSKHVTTVGNALKRIKEGSSRKLVEQVRRLPYGPERDACKKRLPSPLFSGVFKSRNDSNIISYTRLICLDFDDCKPSEVKESLSKNKYIIACWTSPSNNGVKALVEVKHPERHLEHFDSLLENFPNLDPSGRNLSRICFESYDPDIHIKTKWEVYDQIVEKVYERKEITVSTNNTIYEKLKTWMMNKGEGFYEGNRNNFVFKLTCGCLRFGLNQDEIREPMIGDFCGGSFTVKELDVILNSVYRNYMKDFGTAEFTEDEKLINSVTRENIEAELEYLDEPLEDVIYLNDIFDEMLKDFHSGNQVGETTHFPSVDERFRWMRGEITIVGGIGNFGKSTMMLQLMLMKALKDGYKWAVFSPEQYPPKFFYNQLIHALVGKSPYKHHQNQMSEQEYREAAEKINDKFYFIYPEKAMPSQDYINRKFIEAMIRHNIDGCMIDPFNAIYRDRSTRMRDDQFLEDFFRVQKKFALENNVYMVIVAHPNSSIQKDERTGDYKCPRVYDFAGGAMWNNKADNIIMFHRPYYNSNPADSTSQFISQKIKKKELNGTTGEAILTFDVRKGRFYDDRGNPLEEQEPFYDSSANSQAMIDAREPYKESDIFDDELPY